MAFSTVDVLRAAKRKLNKGWTVGTPARNRQGRAVAVNDSTAVRFCALGAIRSIKCGSKFTVSAESLLETVLEEKYPGAFGCSVAEFNDAHATTKGDVLRLFTAAIKKAEVRLEESRAGRSNKSCQYC